MNDIKKPSKFYTNAERQTYLKRCMVQDYTAESWRKQAWEWCKTGVFDRKDFDDLLDALANVVAAQSRD